MELNQTTLRGILAAVLSVDPKYVVPKQGNWWNPQDKEANIANWCAYQIKRNRPRTLPFYQEGKRVNNSATPVNSVAVLKIAEIDLQFVGPQSEALANSVAMWPLRTDVKKEFKKVHGAIMNDEYDAISSTFHQEGGNTVMAWNVPNVKVLWYSITDTSQGRMPALSLEGNIKQKRL